MIQLVTCISLADEENECGIKQYNCCYYYSFTQRKL